MGRGADFIGVRFVCEEPFTEILVAELGELGYNSMMETEDGIEGYIDKDDFIENDVKELLERYQSVANITYSWEQVVSRNWNEEWEKNYDPINVDGQCLVRATFHQPDPSFPYEIIINPRMSFGTGHHATTYLMLKTQMEIDHKGKRVLDAGCGTAILAVMAAKLGAEEILGYDNNSWSTDNAPENVELNGCTNITIQEGIISTIDIEGEYDIILANINKNVLLEEVSEYVKYLKPEGYLVLSGFYEHDSDDILNVAVQSGLKEMGRKERNNWMAIKFQKTQ